MTVAGITDTRPYLTFALSEEIFAVEVYKVREILEWTTITRVPQTPDFMRGVINLRGSVVPVIDLRLKFGMAETARSVNTCIIVVEVLTGDDTLVMGMLADSVQEVFELAPESMAPAPRIGTNLDTSFMKGMGKHGDSFIIILDIDRLFGADELAGIASMETDAF
ncbi:MULTISPECIES: chemotaxis protein CheW [Geobacter]|uniref:Chemotaxis protein CheW n=2 Tax=Geobacter TaxID=28231 RepID=A0A0C1TQU6_9BACT|nr:MULTISPECIES: chemotaxis protein CheW [Geobacter]ANA41034.1 chemotaxis protein CheW [Geobacter anodireducens]KIE43144.1 chemotaxis protein CheW [Geobacter soli]MBE2888161.1 chemotaxis protein CheW [Geobacter anodireducens]